jgi:hypothetical protein
MLVYALTNDTVVRMKEQMGCDCDLVKLDRTHVIVRIRTKSYNSGQGENGVS